MFGSSKVKAGEPGAVIPLEPGEHKTLEFRIVPRGTIAGTVVDGEGDPALTGSTRRTYLCLFQEPACNPGPPATVC